MADVFDGASAREGVCRGELRGSPAAEDDGGTVMDEDLRPPVLIQGVSAAHDHGGGAELIFNAVREELSVLGAIQGDEYEMFANGCGG